MKLFSVLCDKCKRCLLISPEDSEHFCDKCNEELRGIMAEFEIDYELGTKEAAEQIMAHVASREQSEIPFYRMMCGECYQITYMFWEDNIQFCACCGEKLEGEAEFIDMGKRRRTFGSEQALK